VEQFCDPRFGFRFAAEGIVEETCVLRRDSTAAVGARLLLAHDALLFHAAKASKEMVADTRFYATAIAVRQLHGPALLAAGP